MLGLAAVFVWQGWTRSSSPQPARARDLSVPRDPIAIADRPIRGAQTARIAVVVYSDFQCPFCGVVARDTLPALVREYVDTGKVLLAFKHLPLAIHPLAPAAAAAGACAAQQGRFWQMHDRLFMEPVRLADFDLRSAAAQAGADLKIYDSCRAGASAAGIVEADRSEAASLGIAGTPTFVFGRVTPDGRVRATDVLTGAKPIAVFHEILQRLLQQLR
jgi:protein-disulfide isomerase